MGSNPLLLVGSVLFQGDPALIDEAKGVIDRDRVLEGIKKARELVEGYGLQFAVDFIIPTKELAENVVELAAESGVIAFIDSPDPEAKIAAYRAVKEFGISGRVIANGIDTTSGDEELNALRKAEISATVLLAFDPRDPAGMMNPAERVRVVKNVLIPKASKAGVDVILVDAVVLDPASIAISGETVKLIKEELGLPAGCAPANALGPVSKKKMNSVEEALGIHASVTTFLRMMGADFIFYGPVRRAKYVAAAAAMTDALLAYGMGRKGIRVRGPHPIRTILREVQKLFASEGTT